MPMMRFGGLINVHLQAALSSENNTSFKSKYCFSYGKLGGDITMGPLDADKTLSVETLNQTLTLPYEDDKAMLRREI